MNDNPPFSIGCRRGDESLETVNVYLDERIIGTAQLVSCGLYRRFICRCELPPGRMYRLWVMGIGDPVNVGILIPEGERYMLDKKIPEKRIATGAIRLTVLPADQQASNDFVTLNPDQPFEPLDQLETAVLGWKNGEIGIFINKSEDACS